MSSTEIVRAYNALRAEFDAERAEARACGHEFPSFEEWSGAESPKAKAQERAQATYDRGEEDLY